MTIWECYILQCRFPPAAELKGDRKQTYERMMQHTAVRVETKFRTMPEVNVVVIRSVVSLIKTSSSIIFGTDFTKEKLQFIIRKPRRSAFE